MKEQTLCCIGHITLDKVVTPQSTVYMPGGTAYYCSYAMRHLNNTDYRLVTAVGESELNVVERMRNAGINVTALPANIPSISKTYTEKIKMTVHKGCLPKQIRSPHNI